MNKLATFILLAAEAVACFCAFSFVVVTVAFSGESHRGSSESVFGQVLVWLTLLVAAAPLLVIVRMTWRLVFGRPAALEARFGLALPLALLLVTAPLSLGLSLLFERVGYR